MSCGKNKPYLHDVQIGDKLYNFLERNKPYTVNEIREEQDLEYPTIVAGDDRVVHLTPWGTETLKEKIPYFLYAPVDVLDPKNLPPRPWKPDEDEWIWGRFKGGTWILAKFYRSDKNGFWCYHQDKSKCFFDEIAPFKGELPPGLEEG